MDKFCYCDSCKNFMPVTMSLFGTPRCNICYKAIHPTPEEKKYNELYTNLTFSGDRAIIKKAFIEGVSYEEFVSIHSKMLEESNFMGTLNYQRSLPSAHNKGEASVVGRAIVGGVIAGGPGAIVGALSAVDKNNRKK